MFPYYLWLRFRIEQGTAALKDEEFPDLEPRPVKTFFRRFSKVAAKVAEWGLIGIVGFKIGLLIFCAEECWRGQRMWESYRHELDATGQSLDWNAMIPALVPDSRNFYSAPMMSEWFVQPSEKIKTTDDISARLKYSNSSA